MQSGLVVVDKPAGWTSHDVVAKLRKVYGQKRVGHAGTLDPDATGVLLVGLGRVTRLLRFLQETDKEYRGTVVFGVATNTLDAAGEVLDERPRPVTRAQVEDATGGFLGDIAQVPPMVSAIKIGGRRLHELAREGIEIERPARRVHVARFDIEPLPELPFVYRAEIDCSSGTYVRSLAADLGRALGGGAHLRALRRTRVGRFSIEEASPLDAIVVHPTLVAMRGTPTVVVGEALVAMVRNGRVLARTELGVDDGDGPWSVVSGDGDLLAVYASHGPERVKPTVVLVPS